MGAQGVSGSTGEVYVFGGPASSGPSTTADLTFAGEATGDLFSFGVASAGDFDGDGTADLLLSAKLEDSYGTSSGAAYLLLGPVTADGTVGTVASAKWTGKQDSEAVGDAVALAGDVDGDGLEDLVIGAGGLENASGSPAGGAYLLLAATGASSGQLDAVADATFEGAAGSDQTGRAVSGAGDVNGDGYEDVLIGAWQRDVSGVITEAGAAYLVLGPVTGTISLLSTADATLEGEAQYDHAGYSVHGGVDADQDGKGDILVGANQEATGGLLAGAAYLYLGPVSGSASLSSADVKLTGENSQDAAGTSVSATSDMDGDTYPEFLIGAPGSSSAAGAGYMIHHARW